MVAFPTLPGPRLRPTFGGGALVLLLSYLAFVSIGFPDAVLGVAWPSIRTAFGLTQANFGNILLAAGAGYCLSGLCSGRLIDRLGVGWLLIASTGLVTAGLLGYALAPSFPVFLALASLIGVGSGAIDAALNYYAAAHFSDAVMNRLHAFFGIGALIGPFLMGAVLTQDVSWRWGYVIVGGLLGAMTLVFILTRRRWDDRAHLPAAAGATVTATPVRAVLRQPLVWLNAILFVLIVGIEVCGGGWAFTVMHERFGQSDAVGSLWAGLYWGAIAFGRLTLGAVATRFGAARMVQLGAAGNIVGGVLYALGPYEVAVAGLLLMGLWMAPLFPLLMSLTPRRLGTATAVHAIGFQVSAAVLGGTVLPSLAGYLAGRSNLAAIGWVAAAGAVVLFLLHGLMMRFDARQSPPVR